MLVEIGSALRAEHHKARSSTATRELLAELAKGCEQDLSQLRGDYASEPEMS